MSSRCITTCSRRFRFITRIRSTAFLLPLFALPIIANIAGGSELTGREAEAIQLATQMFKSKQGTNYAGWPVYGDLRHYTVELERRGRKLEITFVPEQPPLKANEAGTGGGTKYGWEVHYIISLDRMKILEEHYAR
jgi:hypothetical protein